MLIWAVELEPPVQGAGMFTTVTFPDPDGFQTSDVAMVGEGTAVAALLGVEAGVGDAAREMADTRPAEAFRLDAADGTPAAVTTLPASSRHASAPSTVMGPRETIRRRDRSVSSAGLPPKAASLRPNRSIATASTLRLQASGGSGATRSTAGRTPATAVYRV